MSKELKSLRQTLESLYYSVGDALDAIKTLALLAQRECDRGEGNVSGALIVAALYDISYRASDAENLLQGEIESHGIVDPEGVLKRVRRGFALSKSTMSGES